MNVPTQTTEKILFVGTSGSGKTSAASRASELTGIPFVATDSLYWNESWELLPDEEVIGRIDFRRKKWILDANFDSDWEWVWGKADLIVWLNLPIYVTLPRLLVRNVRWIMTPSEWNGQRMPLEIAFGGIVHAIKSHFQKTAQYPERVRHLKPGTTFVECKSTADVDQVMALVQTLS